MVNTRVAGKSIILVDPSTEPVGLQVAGRRSCSDQGIKAELESLLRGALSLLGL